MRKIFLTAAALLLIPAVACAQIASESILSAPATVPHADLTIRDSDGLEHVVHVEVALTEEDQARGLMGRSKMARDTGMLFFFGHDEKPHFFWMKDTLIPLDMLFIRADGLISHIHPNAKPLDESAIASGGPVAAVLELNGGAAAGLGIREGDRVVDTSYFKNKAMP
jgi:uncharacterized protein